jgi:hypothetical protein
MLLNFGDFARRGRRVIFDIKTWKRSFIPSREQRDRWRQSLRCIAG